MTRIVKGIVTLSIAGAALASPALASAANLYVDQDAGDDSNSCMGPGNNACEHIQAAVNKAGTNDVIHVADPTGQTTYAEQVSFNLGKSLVSDSPDRTENVIDGGAGSGVDVFGATGGVSTVQGFTIRGHGFASLVSNHQVSIQNNVFDEPGQITGGYGSEVALGSTSGASLVSGNTFVDPSPVAGQNQVGVASASSGTPQISDNSFSDLTTSIHLAGGSGQPEVSNNVIKGTRLGVSTGAGISVLDGTPAITGNKISSPFFTNPSDLLAGVGVYGYASANAGATLRRNTIVGLARGIDVQEAPGAVSLSGDLIADSVAMGVYTADLGADGATVSDVSATNVTIAGTGAGGDDAYVFQARLTLTSSIIGAAGIDPSTDGRCAIAASRGPVMGNAAHGCDGFQTTADPMFVNAAGGDFHLAAASPMIDAGGPAVPGETDLDGDARGLSGTTCPVASGPRDMGADEFSPNCPPPAGGGSGGSGGSGAIPAAQPSSASPLGAVKCKKKGKRGASKARKCKQRRKR